MNREKISILFKDIQDNISDKIKSVTNQNYLEDKWNYGSGKGGGRTRIFSNGDIEKAGVNFSSLSGNLSEKDIKQNKKDPARLFLQPVYQWSFIQKIHLFRQYI